MSLVNNYVINHPGKYSLNISGNPASPWFDFKGEGKHLELIGPFGLTVQTLSKTFNISYTFSAPEDREWGRKLEDGSWTGMIGAIQRREANFATGPFSMTYERFEAVDFTVELMDNHLVILAGRMNEDHINLYKTLLTFSWQVTVAIAISMILVVVAMVIADVVLAPPTIKISVQKKFSKYFWNLIASLFCEGSSTIPSSSSGKLLVSVWWLAVIVLMNTFSGNLKASMTVKPDFERINTLRDVIRRPQMKPLILAGTAYVDYIKHSQHKDFQQLWKQIEKYRSLVKLNELFTEENLSDVQRGKSVIILDVGTAKTYRVSQFCSNLTGGFFYISRQTFFPHTYTMAFAKDLDRDLAKKIVIGSRRLLESGIFQMWLKEMHRDWYKCSSDTGGQEERSLRMHEMQGVFVLWGVSLAMATSVFFGEILTSGCLRQSSHGKKRTKRIAKKQKNLAQLL